MKKFVVLLGATFLATACSGEKTTMVQSIQKKDKELSCTDVLLEMNEAEFYKNTAVTNRQPSLKNVIMPLGYMSTYMNSADAINAADSRINYLNKIYEIMHCEQEQEQRYGNTDKKGSNQLALANVEPAGVSQPPYLPQQENYAEPQENYTEQKKDYAEEQDGYAAPVPYVQVDPGRKAGRYVPGAYGQPTPEMERYLASAPYPDGYTPVRPRYEERRRAKNQDFYGYGYGSPSYEESIPEGAPIQSRY